MASGSHVACPNVPLQVAWVRENLVAVLTGKSSKLSMNHFVPKKVGPPRKALIAMFTHIFLRLVSVAVHHVLVQAEDEEGERKNSERNGTYM